MGLAAATVKKGEGRSLKAGGPWLYDNEIESVMGDFEDGDIVLVRDFDGYPLGRGFINRHSRIRIRMLTRDIDQEIDDAFLYRRVKAAWEYRKQVVDTGSCRVIYGEADFLPGLVIDKFSDVLVVESLALGIDRLKKRIVDLVKQVLAEDGIFIRGVYERSDARDRKREGMENVKGFIGAPFDTKVEITENDIRYLVDVEEGQKTGFFLDQKYNRLSIRKVCPKARVLDCFTHTGSFALNAAYAGASYVLGVDASEVGIAQAKENAALNGLGGATEFLCEDVFDLLPRMGREGQRFDVVILDPPAFAKSRKSVKSAVKGYRKINQQAMELIEDGGYLVTCSCSHFIDAQLFAKTVSQAADGAHRRLRQVEYRTQAPDHPILLGAEDTGYLKFFLFQVLKEK